MSSDALELALALHRAPIRRFALRDRPLPDDIGEAIRLASAPQPLLGDSAKRLHVPPNALLEAVRFYLQQVLFEPGTDAYRVLGASADAPTGLIRDHYHWLQRWLHPDRRGEDWEALLATRVTWAWGQLRNDNAREAYDAEHRQQRPAPATDGSHAVSGSAAVGWKTLPASAPHTSWLTRILVGLSVASCLALLVLALTHHDQLPVAATQPMATAALHPTTQTPETQHATSSAAPQATLPAVAATLMASASSPATDVTQLAQPHAAASIAAPHPHLAVVASAPTLAAAMPATKHSAPKPAAHARPAPSKPRTRQHQTVPSDPSLAAATATPPPQPVPPPTPTSVATSVPAAAQSQAIAAVEPAPATPAGPPVSLLKRTDMARQRVQAIVAYFRRTDNAQPTWQDARGPFNAQLERAALRQRFGADAALFALDPPTWKLSAQDARFDTTYHISHHGQVLASGRFSLRMAWTEGGWQLARLTLDSSP